MILAEESTVWCDYYTIVRVININISRNILGLWDYVDAVQKGYSSVRLRPS
ncbi:hypothetical protein DSUL_50283 [Desulfovibrionales bacterium]